MAAPLFSVILYKSNKILFPFILLELSILFQNENQMFFLFIFLSPKQMVMNTSSI